MNTYKALFKENNLNPNQKKIVFVLNSTGITDPNLTVIDLMRKAAERGFLVYLLPVYNFIVLNSQIFGDCYQINNNFEEFLKYPLPVPIQRINLEEVDCIFLRNKFDGVIDEQFHKYARECSFHLMYKGVFVLNDPRYVHLANSKLSTFEIDKSVVPPNQFISSNYNDLISYCNNVLKLQGVMKGLWGRGGDSVYFIEKMNYENNIRNLLQTGPVLLQSFVPNEGDKRIVLLNGEPIAWYLRKAKEGSFLNNISAGGSSEQFTLTEQDYRIIEAVKPIIIKYNLYFTGIDILGNIITELNCENPGGLTRSSSRQEALTKIYDFIENRIELLKQKFKKQ